MDITHDLEGLTPSTFYHYRLVGQVGTLKVYGEDVVFVPGEAGSGNGIPQALPAVTTGDALSVTSSAAALLGSANPMGGTTFARFEYGLTTAYGNSTTVSGIGSGSDPAEVVVQIAGLLPGKTYHYRLLATNSLGTGQGEDRTFQTSFANPAAKTIGASPLNSTTIRLSGAVNPRGAPAETFFEYGTDGVNFPNVLDATPATVNGDLEVPVHFDLDVSALDQSPNVTYHFRTATKRPTAPGDPELFFRGANLTFRIEALAGLVQEFPRELDLTERQGQVQVNLIPAGIGAWRFAGEIRWRASGSIATGLTTGDREIEFLPVNGYHQPGRELIGVISGAPMLVLDREYFVSPTPPDSSLRVHLLPADRTGLSVPLSNRVQWRLLGYDGTPWRESGDLLPNLMPGSYLVEFKSALDLDSPPPATVVIAAGQAREATFTYNPDLDVIAGTVRVLPYDTVSTRRNLPYAYVGQIRNDTGSHSGFAVKRRVVATVAQTVFDEVTLSQIPGLQWLFQNDRDVHEPKPQVPRGFYVFDGYAAQRGSENTPGTLSHTAEEFNAAALYFLEDAGRGGFSGFMATDESAAPLAVEGTVKTLVGYPVRGGGSNSNHGRMEATRSLTDSYVPVINQKLFGTVEIKGLSGMQGGPLCIQTSAGIYLPAGIFLGGSNAQNLVRSIDSGVIDLFNRAELTATTGNNHTNGGISQTSYTAISATSAKGALTVILEPAEARLAGALWKIGSDSSFLLSGTRKNNLTPGAYVLQLKEIPGFQAIPQQTTTVLANNLTTVTVTYQPELSPFFSWRALHFGSTANAGDAADGADPDGDGALNLDEYIAGTDPLDPSDVFRATSGGRQGDTFSLTVPVKAGRIYTLQRRTDLASEDWSDVVTEGPVLLNGTLTLTDPAATAAAGFYQVKVESLVP